MRWRREGSGGDNVLHWRGVRAAPRPRCVDRGVVPTRASSTRREVVMQHGMCNALKRCGSIGPPRVQPTDVMPTSGSIATLSQTYIPDGTTESTLSGIGCVRLCPGARQLPSANNNDSANMRGQSNETVAPQGSTPDFRDFAVPRSLFFYISSLLLGVAGVPPVCEINVCSSLQAPDACRLFRHTHCRLTKCTHARTHVNHVREVTVASTAQRQRHLWTQAVLLQYQQPFFCRAGKLKTKNEK